MRIFRFRIAGLRSQSHDNYLVVAIAERTIKHSSDECSIQHFAERKTHDRKLYKLYGLYRKVGTLQRVLFKSGFELQCASMRLMRLISAMSAYYATPGRHHPSFPLVAATQ